jgi:DNA repair protein RadA/Sms
MTEKEDNMAKQKVRYKCKSCGKIYLSWVGRCTNCNEWNTIEEFVEASASTRINASATCVSPIKAKDIKYNNSNRIDTGNSEINRMFGGGIVNDSVNIISAPPGAGKSTFATFLCGILSNRGYKVLYATGEESDGQIKARIDRVLGDAVSDNLYIVSDPQRRYETVQNAIKEIDPDFIVLDSIQTFTLDEYMPSRAGSPTQVVEVANALVETCKNTHRPRAALIIGQMVKNDELAGPRQLEHLVDAVYYFEGDPYEELRICTSSKNRFGELETVFFNINKGMEPIDNPSEYLMTKRDEGIVGSAITIIKEGTMPVAVEIESLISKSFTPYPSRIGEGLKKEQLNIIISILEQKNSMNFYDKNVVIKAMGNVKLQEPATNLAIAASIASSYYKTPMPSDVVLIGDIGLTGELKKVPSIEGKIKEASRMGFKKVIIPEQTINGKYNIQIIPCKTIKQAINNALFADKEQ